MEVVNGYVCFNCSDVARAKKGMDPSQQPGKAAVQDRQGAIPSATTDDGLNRPLASGPRGTRLNVLT